ncbi:permease [Kineococcus siccus]|uniref:permease n=1 Tax=Kineococcus siccus TaxID=2696567 RepID=UPI00196AAB5F
MPAAPLDGTPVPHVGAAPAGPTRTAAVLSTAAFLVLAAGLLTWAKWEPYAARVAELAGTRTWSGGVIAAAAGVEPGSAPSLAAGGRFTLAYGGAVWKALVAGVVLAAAVQTLVPRRWLLGVMRRRGEVRSAVVGGLLATPSMMCTCCTAPVASALRRGGVPTAGVVAYWLGNPLLNPAVLVFLALVAPWPWVATRLVVGVLVVVGGSVLVARLTRDRLAEPAVDAVAAATGTPPAGPEGPGRFLPALLRTAVVVGLEYALVVFCVGAFSGWLFPLGASAQSWGAAALLAALVLGTLAVVPTAGEVPVAQGLAAVGAGGAVVGALLVVLPAVSLPSAVLVARALTARVVLATAAVVVAGGVLAAGLLSALT